MDTRMSFGLTFSLCDGDLLFQDLSGPTAAAIENVTPGYRGANISHIGMAVRTQSAANVIEATPPKVRLTNLSESLDRAKDESNRPQVFVGRLKAEFQNLVPKAVEVAMSLVGRPYDRLFGPDEISYYCSELIVDAFKYANGGNEFFLERPMSFRDRVTGKILPFWQGYFDSLNASVPAGVSGSNPGDISLSDRIDVVHRYGSLTNWR